MELALDGTGKLHFAAQFMVFFLTLLNAAFWGAIGTLLTWDATPLGPLFYQWLDKPASFLFGEWVRNSAFFLGGSLVVLAHLVDMRRWRGMCWRCVRWPYVAIAGWFFLTGIIFMTPRFPLLPMQLCVLFALGSVRVVRGWVLTDEQEENPHSLFHKLANIVAFAFLVVAAILGLVFLADAYFGDHYYLHDLDHLRPPHLNETSTPETDEESPIDMLQASAPAVMGLLLGMVAFVIFLRGGFHKHQADSDDGTIHMAPELKVCLTMMATIAFAVWIGTVMASQDPKLADEVLRQSMVIFIGLGIYIAEGIGISRLVAMAEKSDVVHQLVEFATNDWVKGLMTLVAWPVLPIYLLTEAVHNIFRRCLQRPQPREGPLWLTEEAASHWNTFCAWNWTSVLSKAIYGGLALVLLQVFSRTLDLFLAYLREMIEPMELSVCLVWLFIIEMALFLFPPVAGIPLYMIAGFVIIPKVEALDHGFAMAVLWTVAFCFVLKMTAIAVEQKGIGAPFSGSITVKKFCGVQTSGMKAVRFILEKKGFSVAKIAVLIGGPDWPTSVLTGILGLPLLDMLIGSVPVVVLICPAALAAGFKLRAADNLQWEPVFKICMMAAILLQSTASMVFAYNVQHALEVHKDEIEKMSDPQEEEIIRAVNHDKEEEEQMLRLTGWEVAPVWVRSVLVMGTFLCSCSVGLLVNPLKDWKPFAQFDSTQTISDLPGGSALGIVQPTGRISLLAAAVVLALAMLVEVWKCTRTSCSESDSDAYSPAGDASEDTPDVELVAEKAQAQVPDTEDDDDDDDDDDDEEDDEEEDDDEPQWRSCLFCD